MDRRRARDRDGRHSGKLIGPAPGGPGAGERWTLPERYSETHVCRMLRVAERFGLDPRVVLFQWPPWLQSQVDAYERLREAETHREKEQILTFAGKAVENLMRVTAGAAGLELRDT
jgi:hypothetical protein